MIGTRTFRAPGRVNLIGEHTDYNLGFVLPIALEMAVEVETRSSDDGRLHIWSEQHGDGRDWSVSSIADAAPSRHWSDYALGVGRELARLGFAIEPLHFSIRGTVPEGAGLSSSAALEVASALAFLQGKELDRLEVARLCQRAESSFVGMPCGIMDQFVAVFGVRDSALCIDCRSLDSHAVRLPDSIAVVAVNSMVKHQLGDSAYRTRVAECAEAAKALGVSSLREATLDQIGNTAMADKPRHRAWHLVTENERVRRFVEASEAGDVNEMGQLFIESHASMKSDYEITCPEVDFLVAEASAIAGCFGARMTGGGFGGCTVNLVAADAVEEFRAAISAAYIQAYGIVPSTYLCHAGDGASEIFPSSG